MSALYRLQNLRLINEDEFARMKQSDDAGQGRGVADLLGLPDPDHQAVRNEFRHRFVGLGLEAYRRHQITRGKLVELGAMVDLDAPAIDQLIEQGGLGDDSDSDEAEPMVLLPGG